MENHHGLRCSSIDNHAWQHAVIMDVDKWHMSEKSFDLKNFLWKNVLPSSMSHPRPSMFHNEVTLMELWYYSQKLSVVMKMLINSLTTNKWSMIFKYYIYDIRNIQQLENRSLKKVVNSAPGNSTASIADHIDYVISVNDLVLSAGFFDEIKISQMISRACNFHFSNFWQISDLFETMIGITENKYYISRYENSESPNKPPFLNARFSSCSRSDCN